MYPAALRRRASPRSGLSHGRVTATLTGMARRVRGRVLRLLDTRPVTPLLDGFRRPWDSRAGRPDDQGAAEHRILSLRGVRPVATGLQLPGARYSELVLVPCRCAGWSVGKVAGSPLGAGRCVRPQGVAESAGRPPGQRGPWSRCRPLAWRRPCGAYELAGGRSVAAPGWRRRPVLGSALPTARVTYGSGSARRESGSGCGPGGLGRQIAGSQERDRALPCGRLSRLSLPPQG